MKRYYVQFGFAPTIEAKITIAGPQAEDQVPVGVQALLAMPGIKEVAVLFDHGQGERINLFKAMKETPGL